MEGRFWAYFLVVSLILFYAQIVDSVPQKQQQHQIEAVGSGSETQKQKAEAANEADGDTQEEQSKGKKTFKKDLANPPLVAPKENEVVISENEKPPPQNEPQPPQSQKGVVAPPAPPNVALLSDDNMNGDFPETYTAVFYILVGITTSAILMLVVRVYRLRLSRAERKYGVHGDRANQELTPLPMAIEDVNSDEEDHTLFEVNRQNIRIL